MFPENNMNESLSQKFSKYAKNRCWLVYAKKHKLIRSIEQVMNSITKKYLDVMSLQLLWV